MKKFLLLLTFAFAFTTLTAQSTGNVGINTPNPTATLHIKASGSTATTQALKVEDSSGNNLFTINNDGSVSGKAATSLSSGTATASKGSGMFTASVSTFVNCFLSINGKTRLAYDGMTTDPGFFEMAQKVPYDTVVDKLSLSIFANATTIGSGIVEARLYVNNKPTNLFSGVYDRQYAAEQTYSGQQSIGSVVLRSGDLISYQITGLIGYPLIGYVSMRYTEQ